MLRNTRRSPKVHEHGETVWEVFTRKDKLPVGIAFARIVSSRAHYHRKTHEWYLHVRGDGVVLVGNRRIRFGQGSILYIKPGTIHSAKKTGRGRFEFLAVSYPPWRSSDHIIMKAPRRTKV